MNAEVYVEIMSKHFIPIANYMYTTGFCTKIMTQNTLHIMHVLALKFLMLYGENYVFN